MTGNKKANAGRGYFGIRVVGVGLLLDIQTLYSVGEGGKVRLRPFR